MKEDSPQFKIGKFFSTVLVKASNVVGNTITGLVEGAMKGAKDEITKKRKVK